MACFVSFSPPQAWHIWQNHNAHAAESHSWMTGPDWPSNGEIDIIEGVNKQSTNKMTLHTDPGCTMSGKDCQGNQGCSIDSGPYGANINSAGGAVYALEWTSDGMNIWGWSGGGAPSDATGSNPDPSGWGNPTGSFPSSSSCNVDTFFKNQQIVFDTTFCGPYPRLLLVASSR